MDALFQPLADLVGGSTDQIKVRNPSTCIQRRNTVLTPKYLVTADFLLAGGLPPWKLVSSRASLVAQPPPPVQRSRRGFLLLPGAANLHRVLPAPGEYFGDVLHRQV